MHGMTNRWCIYEQVLIFISTHTDTDLLKPFQCAQIWSKRNVSTVRHINMYLCDKSCSKWNNEQIKYPFDICFRTVFRATILCNKNILALILGQLLLILLWHFVHTIVCNEQYKFNTIQRAFMISCGYQDFFSEWHWSSFISCDVAMFTVQREGFSSEEQMYGVCLI